MRRMYTTILDLSSEQTRQWYSLSMGYFRQGKCVRTSSRLRVSSDLKDAVARHQNLGVAGIVMLSVEDASPRSKFLFRSSVAGTNLNYEALCCATPRQFSLYIFLQRSLSNKKTKIMVNTTATTNTNFLCRFVSSRRSSA